MTRRRVLLTSVVLSLLLVSHEGCHVLARSGSGSALIDANPQPWFLDCWHWNRDDMIPCVSGCYDDMTPLDVPTLDLTIYSNLSVHDTQGGKRVFHHACMFMSNKCLFNRLDKSFLEKWICRFAVCWPCDGKDFFEFSTVLRNRNSMLRFRFRLLTGYGSGYGFWQVTVPFPVLAPYLDHKKHSFLNKSCICT